MQESCVVFFLLSACRICVCEQHLSIGCTIAHGERCMSWFSANEQKKKGQANEKRKKKLYSCRHSTENDKLKSVTTTVKATNVNN